MKQTKIAIIGVGLIGGSLGMALKKGAHAKRYHIIGIGRDPKKLSAARRMKAVDSWTLSLEDGVADADIIVIATPVDLIASMVRKALPYLKKDVVITDAGSAKETIVNDVLRVLKKRSSCFVGAHPMAGTEKGSIYNARAELYRGATTVITPVKTTSLKALTMVSVLWKAAGSSIVSLSPREHDHIVACTSHVPHIIAFALAAMAGGLKSDATKKLIAGSFKDATRVAASSPSDWAAICSANRTEVARALKACSELLLKAQKKLSHQKQLESLFCQGYNARQKL